MDRRTREGQDIFRQRLGRTDIFVQNYAYRGSARIGWARLLKRVFEIDLEHCPGCGGALKITAVIMQAAGELPPESAH